VPKSPRKVSVLLLMRGLRSQLDLQQPSLLTSPLSMLLLSALMLLFLRDLQQPSLLTSPLSMLLLSALMLLFLRRSRLYSAWMILGQRLH
jgi:hypothetical protein